MTYSACSKVYPLVHNHNMEQEDDVSAENALKQSQQLIEAMDEDFAFKSEVSLSQSILMRNQGLMTKIDAIHLKGGALSEEDLIKKNAYMLELQSNMAGMSRLLKEMTAAGSRKIDQ